MEYCKTVVRNSVREALVNATETLIEEVLCTIMDVGVESVDDLKLLSEKDLVQVLKPIQARKLLLILQKEAPLEIEAPISRSVVFPEISPSPSPSFTEVNSVKISWNKMPNKLLEVLKKKKIPEARLRREMVRIVASDILEATSSPNRSFCREVAKKIATTYPESFTDKVCGHILSNGFESLTGQLINRCENLRRNNSLKSRKQIEKLDELADDINCDQSISTVKASKKKKIVDSYGCVSWNPDFPLDENLDSLREKKVELKNLDLEDFDSLKKLIKSTFSLQRQEINGGSAISELLQEWPKLFLEVSLLEHFKILTAIDLDEKLTSVILRRGEYFKFLRSLNNKKINGFCHNNEAKENKYQALELLQAMAIYFDEDLSKYILTSEVCDPHNMEHLTPMLPEAPCLIANGTDALTADSFMLIIDKTVVNSAIPAVAAITSYFAVYFIFNIKYPDEIKVTLEFMQSPRETSKNLVDDEACFISNLLSSKYKSIWHHNAVALGRMFRIN